MLQTLVATSTIRDSSFLRRTLFFSILPTISRKNPYFLIFLSLKKPSCDVVKQMGEKAISKTFTFYVFYVFLMGQIFLGSLITP